MDKLEQIKQKIQEYQNKTAVTQDLKAFLTLVLTYIKTAKDEFKSLSTDQLGTIKDAITYIEEQKKVLLEDVTHETEIKTTEMKSLLAEIKDFLVEVKNIKATPGKDAEPVDYERIIGAVLEQIPTPETPELPEIEEKTPDELVKDINKSTTLIQKDKVDGLLDIERMAKLNSGPNGSSTTLVNGKLAKNLNFTNATLSYQGDTVSITTTGGGGTWGSITGTLSDQTDLQSALDLKAPLTSPTFATSITGSYLTASEMLITDGSKNIVSAPVATYPSLTELTYVKGVTSAIQTQINTKANSSGALTQFVGNGNWKVWYSDGSGDVQELALGADGTFLKSNGAASPPTFATPAGSGDVTKVGTPVNNQIGVWTGDGTLEGDSNLTWDGTSLNIATAKNFQIAGATILSDSAGTTTLSNIDALDATTEATIEGAIDTLANLTSVQGLTVTLADAGANAIFGWDDTAGAYENLTQAEARTVLGLGTAAYVATDLADLNEATIEGAIDTLANLTSVQGLTITLADAGADALLGWDDSAGAYQNLSAADARTALGLGTLATQSGTFSGTSSGTNTGDQSIFQTIAVSGQSNVVADTTTDTLTLVAGTNITITTDAGADSITINASAGGGMTWNEETTTSATMAVDNGYIANNAALVTLTLPTTAAVGKVVKVVGKGAGLWRIAQNASEIIHFGNLDTTTGTGGYIEATHRRDAVELVCVVADTEWNVISSVGNITIV